MSLEELKTQGLLLPEEHWGEIGLRTSVNRWALSAAFCLAALSVALMVLGQGGTPTWVGAAMFVVFLVLFTIVSNAGINRQAGRLQEVLAGPSQSAEKRGNV